MPSSAEANVHGVGRYANNTAWREQINHVCEEGSSVALGKNYESMKITHTDIHMDVKLDKIRNKIIIVWPLAYIFEIH